ncbi:MAG TPA: response regulator [Tepidisphaeraceae bacterium]|nr:response regulator [Tepidisphaeraceae bacterium]
MPLQRCMEFTDDEIRSARILIIDADETSAFTLDRMLKNAGYAICITITDPRCALAHFREHKPDLVLLGLHMEPITGIVVIKQIGEITTPRSRPPIVMLTGDTTTGAKRAALEAGATDFLAKPLDEVEVLLRIKNLLHAHSLYRQCQTYSHGLEQLVEKRTTELQQQTHELEQTLADLRETQQQVIQQERLRALGTMASGIAHDLNNGLSLILGFGDILLRDHERFPLGSRQRHHLEAIVTAGHDNAKLVKRLREFYRPRANRETRESVDLNALVTETIELTSPKWQAEAEARGLSIQVEAALGQLPPIAADPAELREVMTNLVLNAVDAMPHGGRLLFRTGIEGSCVRLELADSGTGMTEETRRHCLEPFYTTKGERGSGLGLSMSYGIIRRHGGTIDIASSIDHGTTFIIHLPILRGPLAVTPHAAAKALRPLRVLVVDDQPQIREIVSAYLAEDRHIVETAAGGREALEKFHDGCFDLVITDRAMPEMSGEQLANAIRQIRPAEPVILLTGFADLVHETGQSAESVDLVVSKPARLDDLRCAILEVMSNN